MEEKTITIQEMALCRFITSGNLILKPIEKNRIDLLIEEILNLRHELRINHLECKEIILTPQQYDMLLRNFRYRLMDRNFANGIQNKIYGMSIIVGKSLKEEE